MHSRLQQTNVSKWKHNLSASRLTFDVIHCLSDLVRRDALFDFEARIKRHHQLVHPHAYGLSAKLTRRWSGLRERAHYELGGVHAKFDNAFYRHENEVSALLESGLRWEAENAIDFS